MPTPSPSDYFIGAIPPYCALHRHILYCYIKQAILQIYHTRDLVGIRVRIDSFARGFGCDRKNQCHVSEQNIYSTIKID
jgi:hypothetical protein